MASMIHGPDGREVSWEDVRVAALKARNEYLAFLLRVGFRRIWHWLRGLLARWSEARARHALYCQLRAMSERELKDIGLTHSDLAWVLDRDRGTAIGRRSGLELQAVRKDGDEVVLRRAA